MRRSSLLIVVSASWLVAQAACGSSDQPTPPSDICDGSAIVQGCVAGHCRITAAAGALPTGAVAAVKEEPAPSSLAGDTPSGNVCTVTLPQGTTSPVTLEIDDGKPLDKTAIAFSVDPRWGTANLVAEARRSGTKMALDVSANGSFGVSSKPPAWGIERYLGSDSSNPVDGPTLLRNLSAQVFTAGFWDGTRLYVGNGNRILVYVGLPSSDALPAVVLGQPDLTTTVSATSSALFGAAATNGIWSDGKRLVVSQGNRVLIWFNPPTQNLTPADIVLGQTDGASNVANAGGLSASSLSSPTQVDSDGTQLVVADAGNHRLLVWKTFPTSNGQPADFVVGQPDFKSATPNGGQIKLATPEGSAFAAEGLYASGIGGPGLVLAPPVSQADPPPAFTVFSLLSSASGEGVVGNAGGVHVAASSGVGVRDLTWPRVLFTRTKPTALAPPDFVLGQPDYPRIVSRPWANGLYTNPGRVLASSFGQQVGLSSRGAVVIPDDRRLLIWDKPPSYDFEPPTVILGQPGGGTNERNDYRGLTSSSLAEPADIAIGDGYAAIADRGNNRVVLFKSDDVKKQGATPIAILGQPDGTKYLANGGAATASASSLSGPEGTCIAGGHLAVADTENHRVLLWTSIPTSNGKAADVVLGQPDFASHRPNHGSGDVSPVDGHADGDAKALFYPTGVACDAGHLFVTDRLNHRVLAWDTWPTSNGAAADRVLGQPSMTSVRAARGQGPMAVAADGFNLPTGIHLSGGKLWVADTEDNRVVRFDDPFAAVPSPSAFVGQPNGTTVTNSPYQGSTGGSPGAPNPVGATSTASVLRPRGIAIAGGRLFVSETDSNRVHVLDVTSLAHVGVLGQPSPTTASPNAGGVGASSLAEPMGIATDGTSIFVVDARNHRVLGWDAGAVSGASASWVIGQPSFVSNGFNASSVAKGGTLAQPRGLALVGDDLFVADTANHRVLDLDAKSALVLKKVYGQPNDVLALPNAGGAPSASTLSSPQGVFADANHVVVADTGNHRVLVFDPKSSSASVVLGQPDFTTVGANTGGPSGSTLFQPKGVCSDGNRLFVVDSGNSRVLGWSAFPTTNGQPADVVLGQADASKTLPNRGESVPTASSMSLPSACVILEKWLFVADTANNRVLRFFVDASTNANATEVFGQPTFGTRGPATLATDLSLLAGPVALATDAANLYVVDRDLARVLRFPRATVESKGAAVEILGGLGSASILRVSGGIAVARAPLLASRLYGTETTSDRVAVVAPVSRLQE
jgi:sugar lactone lactonase YvrE